MHRPSTILPQALFIWKYTHVLQKCVFLCALWCPYFGAGKA